MSARKRTTKVATAHQGLHLDSLQKNRLHARVFVADCVHRRGEDNSFAAGRTCSHRCVASPAASFVTACGVPPAEIKRYSGPDRLSPKIMLPSRPQLPPRGLTAAQRSTVEPPSTETFFNLPSAKKPIHS